MADETNEEKSSGLNALDWIVIVAAAVSLVIAITWLVQGAPLPGPKSTEEKS